MDFAVYTAIKDIDIDSKMYPAIYRWRHAVSLYPEEERLRFVVFFIQQ